jgi:hypothetical protein
MMAKKKVRLVCDECGDDHLTDVFVKQMADGIGVDEDRIHEMILDGDILLEGCHAIRAVE